MLVKFQWDDINTVSVSEMDKQHKRFFEIANEIVDFINQEKTDKDELQILLSNLVGYSIYHLEFEERYFTKYKYEDRFVHIESHDAYRKKIQSFVNESEKADANIEKIARETAEFASKWLQEHILIEDKKYSEFFSLHPIEDSDDYRLLI